MVGERLVPDRVVRENERGDGSKKLKANLNGLVASLTLVPGAFPFFASVLQGNVLELRIVCRRHPIYEYGISWRYTLIFSEKKAAGSSLYDIHLCGGRRGSAGILHVIASSKTRCEGDIARTADLAIDPDRLEVTRHNQAISIFERNRPSTRQSCGDVYRDAGRAQVLLNVVATSDESESAQATDVGERRIQAPTGKGAAKHEAEIFNGLIGLRAGASLEISAS